MCKSFIMFEYLKGLCMGKQTNWGNSRSAADGDGDQQCLRRTLHFEVFAYPGWAAQMEGQGSQWSHVALRRDGEGGIWARSLGPFDRIWKLGKCSFFWERKLCVFSLPPWKDREVSSTVLIWTSPGTNLFPHLEWDITSSLCVALWTALSSCLGIRQRLQFLARGRRPTLHS